MKFIQMERSILKMRESHLLKCLMKDLNLIWTFFLSAKLIEHTFGVMS